MELRLMQYFVTVAEEKSISRAAEKLHITQPTLSRQLRDMEEELGKPLLIRGSRNITLTEAGYLLYNRSKEIIELSNRTKQEISYSGEMLTGHISIGATNADSARVLVTAAQQLHQESPLVQFNFGGGNKNEYTEGLALHRFDFAVFYGGYDSEMYDCLKISNAFRHCVFLLKSDPLAQKTVIAVEDLWRKPLIVGEQLAKNGGLSTMLGCTPDEQTIVATYNTHQIAQFAVEAGMGYALVQDNVISLPKGSPACMRPLDCNYDNTIYIVYPKKRPLSPAAQRYLSILREHIAQQSHCP